MLVLVLFFFFLILNPVFQILIPELLMISENVSNIWLLGCGRF